MLFRGLQEINNNGLILFETLGGNYTYRLETTEIVKPQDVEVLEACQYPELMLVTCYPFDDIGPALEPFIVKARQVPPPGAETTGITDAIAPDAAHPATIRTPLTEESGESPKISDEAPNPVSSIVGKGSEHMAAVRRFTFELSKGRSRQFSPEILFALTGIETGHFGVNGSTWVMRDRRASGCAAKGTRSRGFLWLLWMVSGANS